MGGWWVQLVAMQQKRGVITQEATVYIFATIRT
jgi:hypothetical protein